jgi:glycine/serine hydroxymethyltransferase
MGVEEMRVIGDLIAQTLEKDRSDFTEIRQTITELAQKYPLYQEIN